MKRMVVLLVAVACAGVAMAAVKEPPALKVGAEALKTMAENVYGVRPAFPDFKPKAEVVKTEEVQLGEVRAVRKVVRLNTMTPLGEVTFPVVAYFPKQSGKVPAFVYLSFKPSNLTDNPRWPLELILGRGAATAAFCYDDVLKDDPHVLDGVKRPPDGWGAISAWALAAGRVADWLLAQDAVDGKKLAVVGHSRLGKTAAWAGATDPRFAYACVNDSGCLGARMSYRNQYGETIDQITKSFPHWFAPNCRARWCGKENELPFDQHWVLGSIAPRLLNVGSADEDWWACPPGEMAGYEYARPAWKGRDIGNVTYHIRHGQHNITAEDWTDYLDFAASRGWPVGAPRVMP